jgi:hypothetical protein
VPRSFSVEVRSPHLPYDVELDIRIEEGVPVCDALRAIRKTRGEAVTGEGIRKLPVAMLVGTAVDAVGTMIHRYPLGAAKLVDQRPDDAGLQATRELLGRVGGRRRTLDRQFLLEVAKVWRSAPPNSRTKAVSEWGFTTRQNARKWVAAAESGGLIPNRRKP